MPRARSPTLVDVQHGSASPDAAAERGSAERGLAFLRPAARTKQLLMLGSQVASGLAFLHKQGVVHRDIKCSNVLLDATRTVAKVSDFGLAHVIARREGHDAMATPTELHRGMQLGTLRYLAPECAPAQHDGTTVTTADGDGVVRDGAPNGALIARDVYAWACLLYELLHEEVFFAGVPSLDSLFLALSGKRPRLSLPAELAECAELIGAGWHPNREMRGSIEAACPVLERLAHAISGEQETGESASSSSSRVSTVGSAQVTLWPSSQFPHDLNLNVENRTGTAKIGDMQSYVAYQPAEPSDYA